MIVDQVKWIYDMLTDQFTVSHLVDKVDSFIFDTDNVPAKVHKAIKEKYNAKFLKDASYVLWFWDKSATAPEDDESGEDNNTEVEEAESVTGGFTPELKTQVIKSIMKVFHCQTKEEVDTFDLDLSGKSYFFVKLSWK